MFAPKSGCPMCGIVAQAPRFINALDAPLSPQTIAGAPVPEILWRDSDFTAYREKTNPVSSKAHVVILFNLHVPSLYTLSSSDLPLLSRIRDLASRLLTSYFPPPSPLFSASSPTAAGAPPTTTPALLPRQPNFCIGFIAPPFYDTKIPVTDHLHAHAYVAPADKAGWFRSLAYSGLAWYDIDDLIAEIRESVSNNRVKSGYRNRKNAPIERVPDAGSRAGTASGRETTEAGLAVSGPSDPRTSSSSAGPRTSSSSNAPSSSSHSGSRAPGVGSGASTPAVGSPVAGNASASASATQLLSPPPTDAIPHLQV